MQYKTAAASLTMRDPLLTGSQVADLIGLKSHTLTKWRSQGRAPRAVKLDQIVRYRESDVDRWIDLKTSRLYVPRYVDEGKEKFMTLTQASDYLAMSGPSISTWRSRTPDYAPPGIKVGSRLRFRLTDLNEWVQRHLEPLPDTDAPVPTLETTQPHPPVSYEPDGWGLSRADRI